ncbi:MAG: hypothetical protein ACOYYI_01280 [Chloroflexota bacterium]
MNQPEVRTIARWMRKPAIALNRGGGVFWRSELSAILHEKLAHGACAIKWRMLGGGDPNPIPNLNAYSDSDSESDSDVDMQVQNGEVSFQSGPRRSRCFVENGILARFCWDRRLAMPCSYVPNPNRIPNPIRNAHSESESERWSSFCFAGC